MLRELRATLAGGRMTSLERREWSVLPGYRRENDRPALPPPGRTCATRTRAPKQPLVPLAHTLSEVTGPVFGHERVGELDHDLTRQHASEPLGERIIVSGRVLDGDGRPVPQHADRAVAGQRRRAATATTWTAIPRRSTPTSPAPGAA